MTPLVYWFGGDITALPQRPVYKSILIPVSNLPQSIQDHPIPAIELQTPPGLLSTDLEMTSLLYSAVEADWYWRTTMSKGSTRHSSKSINHSKKLRKQNNRSLFCTNTTSIYIPGANRDHNNVWNPSISEGSQNKALLLPSNTTTHSTHSTHAMNDKKGHKTLKTW